MNKTTERLLMLMRKKYPENQYDGFVSLKIYSDESGYIAEAGNYLFEFTSIAELVEHLTEE